MPRKVFVVAVVILNLTVGEAIEHATPQVSDTNSSKPSSAAQKFTTTANIAVSKPSGKLQETKDNVVSKGAEGRKNSKNNVEQDLKLFCNITGRHSPPPPLPGLGNQGFSTCAALEIVFMKYRAEIIVF
jgi:hypothetical protein